MYPRGMILPQLPPFDNSQLTNCARPRVYNGPMQIIYVDSLFLLNLLTDYLICLTAAGICGLTLKRGRYLLAALLGAAYAVAAAVPNLAVLSSPPGKLAAGLLMSAAAFAGEARFLRCTAVFFAAAALFGGAVWVLGEGLSLSGLLLCFLLCAALLRLLFLRRSESVQRMQIRLFFRDREAVFTALRDTGNGLRDPISGAPVLVASPQALRPVLGELTDLFLQTEPTGLLELLDQFPELRGHFRLLPYSSLGGSGLLPVFRPEKLLINGKRAGELLVAVSGQAKGEDFEGIL